MQEDSSYQRLRKAKERANALGMDLIDRLVQEMRKNKATDDQIVKALSELISEPAMVGHIVLKLMSPTPSTNVLKSTKTGRLTQGAGRWTPSTSVDDVRKSEQRSADIRDQFEKDRRKIR